MSENKLTRLCHMVKRADFDGYGFNLHAEKGKPGQYIGKVDDNSPAETAGLKQGDRIIEVNGVNIGNETHKQVVARIKAIADEVQLLVVDPSIVSVSNNNQVIDGSTTNSVTSTITLAANEHSNGNDTNDSVSNDVAATTTIVAATATTNGRNGQSPNSNKSNDSHAHNPTLNTSSVTTTTTTATKGANSEGLNLKMTAAELRAKLAAKKKYDPKNDTVDLRKKYEIVQKL
ncbi:Na(+)/H(+) exchange regulatory cofactor NHE-RF2 [Sitodiplosis mosellana]|uniref:Na(+)/H(+) exchange regulatory cofactor NHE-RF2 n=1 Tax=Sitodiplosis mosellana TaxID=263140 RepID=UPI002443A4BD|nr:Na(+)/H(+) exchange regulatory cofactor NHE-RF2 [Sitodiplosis mosellana]XP_055318274.1 Na(+)/H(+) exchange regulatory cofactor NHE-RF2 [Sitodiplosis mosellana]XP_055318275.1 Na(+)/H(+) exchange regulatory cofactor NHE-RF2 [Sitodiplosis mosellana]XP_055318276.1 Na(+)/H(+) exchange regulatory cofactor NHE-RF2 [Sitodiplosis mosellana]XP_055318278.1 Na(+)/H(+) exchange regulatory cofactor NHE-RF2 [Sitodiplosis mosellana]XP_055318279.1 Na(+)/H(+) exchange regulatory cofactor NHE-RF2 [Sitodiplosi